MSKLISLALGFTLVSICFEAELGHVHAKFGMTYLILIKALDYKKSHPNISILRRYTWMFGRVFIWGIFHQILNRTNSFISIVINGPAFIIITALVHYMPNKWMKQFYMQEQLTALLLRFLNDIFYACYFVINSGSNSEAYEFRPIFVIIFVFAEVCATEIAIAAEHIIHGSWKDIDFRTITRICIKYLLASVIMAIYFYAYTGTIWKKMDYHTSEVIDFGFRSFIIVYFMLFIIYDLGYVQKTTDIAKKND